MLILEFFRPTRWWPRVFLATVGRWLCPLLGGLVAKDAAAYRYLHDSVQRFLSLDEAKDLLAHCGFTVIGTTSCFGGVANAIAARRM